MPPNLEAELFSLVPMTAVHLSEAGQASIRTLTGAAPGATRHFWISWDNLNVLQIPALPVLDPSLPLFNGGVKEEPNPVRQLARERLRGYLEAEQTAFLKTIYGVVGFDTMIVGRAWRARQMGDAARDDEVAADLPWRIQTAIVGRD